MLSLDKLFENLDIVVYPFAFCSVQADASLPLGPRDESTIHYVLGGEGTLSFGGYPPFDVKAGAMIVAPAHTSHDLTGRAADIPESVRQCRPLSAELVELGRQVGELNEGIAVACGSVDATYRALNNVFEYLPEPIMIQSRRNHIIWQTFDNILRELTHPREGSKAMLKLLFQQCFIEFLREHSESGECRLPWLLALDKPRFNHAIESIIDDPGKPHTLESLAGMCAMSRSSFASHFSEAFGRSAMDFVKEVRLRKAAQMLVHTDTPIKTIAADIGYESRSHFSHAFHEFFSLSPVEYRRRNGHE